MTMPIAGLALVILFTTLMIIDLWLVLFRNTGSSVSNWVISMGFKSPVAVFGLGFLMGHLFGGMSILEDPRWYTPGYNLAYSIYFLGVGLIAFAVARMGLFGGRQN